MFVSGILIALSKSRPPFTENLSQLHKHFYFVTDLSFPEQVKNSQNV